MSKTRIFYFIPNLQQGGTELQLLRLLRELPDRFEPVLCLYDRVVFAPDLLPPGLSIHVLGRRRMDLAGLSELTRLLRQERPDILHSFRDKANFWARLAARQAGVPIVITSCRTRVMQARYLLVERLLSDRADLVLVNSASIKRELVSLARVRPEKVQVIHNILDTRFFRPPTPEERCTARSAWRLADGHVAFLLPGRVGLQKHQLGLLIALARLARGRRLPADAIFLLAGRRRDAGVAWLVDRFRGLPSLREHVRLVGAKAEVRDLYWAADVLLLPSLYEGLSNAVLEGCAAGLPVILSRAANLDGIVVDGETGLEVPTFWPGPLTNALARMLALGPVARRDMGARGRERVVARFGDSARPVAETVGIYDRLLREKGLHS